MHSQHLAKLAQEAEIQIAYHALKGSAQPDCVPFTTALRISSAR
jgi:hypothetical protein